MMLPPTTLYKCVVYTWYVFLAPDRGQATSFNSSKGSQQKLPELTNDVYTKAQSFVEN